jgi:4-hydroxy-tetrahydrodipicolinate synthase
VPGRTGQLLTSQAIAHLCQIPRVDAVKEASGDVALYSRALLAANKSKHVAFLSGDDPTYLASLAVGGSGVISVVSNIFPDAMLKLTHAVQDGNYDKARRLHNTLLPAIDILFCESNPGPLKAAFEILGLAKNIVRAPLAPVSKENYAAIQKILNETKVKLEAL